MLRILAPFLCLALALPALAEMRPAPRPASVAAFAGATETAPRRSPRPVRNPYPLTQPAALRITLTADDLARHLARQPAARMPVVMPVLAGLLPGRAPWRGNRPEPTVVTMSAANAVVMPDVAAVVRAAFVAVPGPVLQPRARPAEQRATPVVLTLTPRLRPAARPALADPALAPVPEALVPPRPLRRPADLVRRATPEPEAEIVKTAAVRVNPGEQLMKPKKGSICGDGAIRGAAIPPIPAQVKGCGIAEPVRVTEVDGVRLSPAATMDCTTAKALKSWVVNGLKPAAGKRGVAQLNVAAGYACRSRNNIKGNRISEHGKGRAIDVASVTLGNGQVLDVLRDYRRDAGKALRAAHKKACGIFGTTLGPGSDGYHENNLHFDTAAYRSGPYCR